MMLWRIVPPRVVWRPRWLPPPPPMFVRPPLLPLYPPPAVIARRRWRRAIRGW